MVAFETSISAEAIVELAHRTANFVILGKATSNTAPDIEFGDRKYILTQLFWKISTFFLS